MVALVDDEDYEYLSQHKWYAAFKNGTWYAKRGIWVDGKTKCEFMHRVIMNAPIGLLVDHKDGNGLNNQKTNIRLCTALQNARNKKPLRKFKGTKKNICGNFEARIKVNGKLIQLGIFKNEIDAAITYNNAAIKYFGEFARLNIIDIGNNTDVSNI